MQVHRDGCLEGGEGAGLRGGADRVHSGGHHRLHRGLQRGHSCNGVHLIIVIEVINSLLCLSTDH